MLDHSDLELKKLEEQDKMNVFNRLLSFFKELIGKSEEYQGELQLSCMELLLNVPLPLLYNQNTRTDNIEQWKGLMLRALERGHQNSWLANTCIKMLEQWFNKLPPTTTVQLYEELLP